MNSIESPKLHASEVPISQVTKLMREFKQWVLYGIFCFKFLRSCDKDWEEFEKFSGKQSAGTTGALLLTLQTLLLPQICTKFYHNLVFVFCSNSALFFFLSVSLSFLSKILICRIDVNVQWKKERMPLTSSIFLPINSPRAMQKGNRESLFCT